MFINQIGHFWLSFVICFSQYIINDLVNQEINLGRLESKIIVQQGDWFALSGWAKHTLVFYGNEQLIDVIDIQSKKIENPEENYWKTIFRLQYYINKQKKNLCYINASSYFQNYPTNSSSENQSKIFSKILQQENSLNIYYGIQDWHFFIYEFKNNLKGSLQIHFFNDLGIWTSQLGDEQFNMIEINQMFQIYVGENPGSKNQFFGQLYKIIFYNNDENGINNFFQINKGCFTFCENCDGPFDNNCLSCKENNNRIFIEEKKECICKLGYKQNNQQECISDTEIYPNLQISEQINNQDHLCELGYYLQPISSQEFQCQQCPQNNQGEFYCLECILNPYTWYILPYCQYYLQQRRQYIDDAYLMNEQTQFYYYINENYQLIRAPYILEFSNTAYNFKYEVIYHLNQSKFALMKDDSFDQQQLPLQSNCFNINYNNTNCIQCLPGYQWQGDFCVKCQIYNYYEFIRCRISLEILRELQFHQLDCGYTCKECDLGRCKRCIDDYKYFLASDGKNCRKNEIPYCIQAFQASAYNFSQNTLKYQFEPFQQKDSIILCARCKDDYSFVFSLGQCVKNTHEDCLFGVAQTMIQNQDNSTKKNNPSFYYKGTVFDAVQYQCLISLNYSENSLQFYNGCNLILPHCITCLFYKNQEWVCLKCEVGYNLYYDNNTPCIPCFLKVINNCLSWNDYDNLNLVSRVSAMQYYVSGKINYFYSTILRYYQIDVYEEQKQKNQQRCHKTCSECAKNKVCLRCKNDIKGRPMSLSSSKQECIECPTNCALCAQRTALQISLINPLFNNTNSLYNKYTRMCLRDFNEQQNYFDREIGQFVKCANFSNCKKQLILELNLICSMEDYLNQLEQMDENDRSQFQSQNILFEDLLVNQFSYYDNENFYEKANRESIHSISIKITTQKTQICISEKMKPIFNKFSQNIFSAIEVNLEFDFQFEVRIILQESLKFENFTSIKLKGLNLQSNNRNLQNFISFENLMLSYVFLDNLTIQNELNLVNCSVFSFMKVSQIIVNNFSLSSTQMNHATLFFIKSTSDLQVINLSQVTLLNNKLNYFSLVVFPFEKNIEIKFKDIKILNCEYNDSYLAQKTIKNYDLNSIFIQGFIQIFNIQIVNTKIINEERSENQKFLDLDQINVVNIKDFSIVKSYLLNSHIFNLNYNASVENLSIQECNLVNSTILINSFGNSSFISYNVKNVKFIKNSYTSNSNFIKLLSDVKNSELNLERLNISQNLYANYSKQIRSFTLNQSLIYIEIDKVTLTDIFISRGQGLVEMSFAYQTTLIIKYGFIIQNQKILGIHEKLECNPNIVNSLSTVFNLYSINKLLIQDIQIKDIEIIDSPIIYYRSLNADSDKTNNQFTMINVTVVQSLTQILNRIAEIGILKVYSDLIVNIYISDCYFNKNIMQGLKGTLGDQASILNIDAILSNFKLQNTIFKQNLVLNSGYSINFINCKIIEIKNCSFVRINIIEYQIIQPFLLWDFPFHAQVYLDDILNILQIDSISSNGLLKFQTLVMEEILVKESKAVSGVGFQFLPQNKSEIIVQNIKLQDLENNLQHKYSESGGIVIDFSKCLNANVKFSQIIGERTHFFNRGSFFQFLNCKITVKILIEKSRFNNIFSPSASIINIKFENESNYTQSLQIKDLHYQNTLQGWENYLQKYWQENIILKEDFDITNIFFLNRTVFYIFSGKTIQFDNIVIIDLFMESGFNLVDVSNLVLSDVQIINSTMHKNLIQISQKDESLHSIKTQTAKSEILIQNIKIVDLSYKNFEIHCQGLNRGQSYLLCNAKTIKPPEILQNFETNIMKYCQTQETDLFIVDSIISLLQISSKVIVKQLELKNILCSSCQQGLVQIEFINNEQSNQMLQIYNSILLHCKCGQLSCIHIQKIQNYLQNKKLSSNLNQISVFKQNEILIDNYFCQNNQAHNGTCFFINNLRLMIKNSIFSSNKAIHAGGALYLSNNQNDFKIQNSFIFNNQATFGGGVYINNQFSQNFKLLQSFIQNNEAFAEGQNIYSNPIKLKFQYGSLEKNCEIKKVFENTTDIIEEVLVKQNKTIFGIDNFLHLPNGQEIRKYQYFDWKNRKYFNPNLTFRIVPLSQSNEKSVNLSNTFCKIKSGILLISKEDQNQSIQYTNNYTSYNIIKFNDQSQDYNLDDIELYFDNESDDTKFLTLEFQCDSISVPTFSNKYPYNFISNKQNYTLRFYIKPLPCQLGEIKNLYKRNCQVCDSSSGFFILKLNQNNCQIKDDISTFEVTPTQLKLRSGFWRPYFDTSIISYCSNLPSNCLGGWIEGDTSCLSGHIGAQCEQCDLLNLRGDGQYFRTSGYQCQLCYKKLQNLIMIAFLSIYILLSILLSVTSNIQSVEQQLKMVKMKLIGFRVIFQYNQKAILFKLLTNYFQIISIISNLQSNFSEQFKATFDITTTPSQELTFSFDCILSQNINLSIHYIRMILLLCQPILSTLLIFILYFFSRSCQYTQFNKLFISTTLIYVYIYFQPNLVGKLVQLLSYREISSYKWILAHVAFRYDEQIHFEIMVYILIPILIIIGIFIPSGFLYGLFTNQNKLDQKAVRIKWGYLYCEYRKEAYLWEILRISKKILLLGFLNYYQDFSKIQAIIIILTLLLYLQISKNFKPYQSKQLSNLDYSINNTCLLSTCILLSRFNSEYSQIQQFIFIAINLRLIKIILQEIIISYFQEISKSLIGKIDKLRDYIRNKFPYLKQFPFIWKALQNKEQKQKRISNLYQKLKAYLIVKRKQRSEKQKSTYHKTLMTLTGIQQTLLKSSNSENI